MPTGIHDTFGLAEETIDECATDTSRAVSEDRLALDDSSDAMEAVLALCEETSRTNPEIMGIAEMPSFAEEGFDVHQIDVAPRVDALVRREQQLRRSGDYAALAQLLIERAESTRTESQAANLLLEAATIYEDHLGSSPGAQAILAKALEFAPGHLEAADRFEALAQRSGEWDDLIETFSEAANRLQYTDPDRAGELCIRLACAQAQGTHDLAGAFSTLEQVRTSSLGRVQDSLDSLERMIRGLGQLEIMIAMSRRVGDDERSTRLMSRAIAMSQSVIERANYHHQIAMIAIERSEEEAAVWHCSEAVRLDPSRNDVRDALAALFRQRGEFRKAVRVLEDARACSSDADRRARYACEAAQIYSESLGESTRAVDLFAVALQLQPGSHAASLPVVERYFEQERWNELESVLDSLLGSDFVETQEAGTLSELYTKAGTCSLALGNHAKALQYFRLCLEYDIGAPKAHEGSARCRLALGDYSEAIAAAQSALAVRELSYEDSDSVSMLAICASAHRSLGQQARAIELYERCARHEHAESLQALADLHTQRGDHHEAVAVALRIAESQPRETRVAMLCQASDTLANEIGDIESAIDLCWQGLSLKSDSRAALHRLAVLYTKNEEWREAIKTIVRMAGLETGALRRGRYLQAAGVMAHQKNFPDEAVALLDRAIESYFADSVLSLGADIRATCFECFEIIVSTLRAADDWRGVERNYRKMICRLEPGDPDVPRLWSDLGHVYREKLGETTAAIDSFEVASSLQQDSLTNHRILVDLYEGAGPDQLDKAIARRRLLLEAEPSNAEHYKALRGLYVRTRQMDRVWCMCRALDSMGQAENRELAFYRRNLSVQMSWPTRQLNAEMWSRFRDPRVEPNVSRIFGLVGEVVAQHCTLPAGQTDLREQMGAEFDHLRQLFSATSYAFGLPAFDCFVEAERERAVTLLNLRRGAGLEPTFVLGEDLYRGRSVQQIVSSLGRFLSLGRRSYYLRLALPDPGELAAAFYAGLSLVHPSVVVPGRLQVRVDTYRASLAKNLHPTWTRKLHQAAGAFLQGGARFDVATWSEGADATARHAAVLLSGDLAFGLAEIANEVGMTSERLQAARDALRLASVSEAHLSLREELGLVAVQPD